MNGVQIAEVETFTYLGVDFMNKGLKNIRNTTLFKKAIRAQYKLVSHIGDAPMDLTLRLYRQLIIPITTYGSEIWGLHHLAPVVQKKSICEAFGDYNNTQMNADKIQLSFAKRLLNVNRRAINAAVRGELGLFPVYITVLANGISYAARILKKDNNDLLEEAVLTQKIMIEKGQKCWLANALIILRKITGPTASLDDLEMTNGKVIRQTLQDEYVQHWYESIWGNSSDKCRLKIYRAVKDDFAFADYLNNPQGLERTAMVHLRLSAHQLGVELGRRTPDDPQAGYCTSCQLGVIEDEEHIFQCASYEEERKKHGIMIRLDTDVFAMLQSPTIQVMRYIKDVLGKRKPTKKQPQKKRKRTNKAEQSKKRKKTGK